MFRIANLAFVNAMIVPAVAMLFALIHRAMRPRVDTRESVVGAAAAIGGAALGLLVTQLELGRDAAPVVWALGSAITLGVIARDDARRATAVAVGFAAVAGFLVLERYGESSPPAHLLLNARFSGALAAIGAVAAIAIVARRRGDAAGAWWAWCAVLAGLGAALGAELRGGFGLSIAWSAYAAALLAIGFALRHRALRLAGLGLLGVVAIKLVIYDLAGVAPLHRVLSFLTVGAVMIAASYGYHRLEQRR